MKAHLCRAANPKGVLMSHSCAAPTIVTHSDDATFLAVEAGALLMYPGWTLT